VEIEFISNSYKRTIVIRHEPANIKVMRNANITFSSDQLSHFSTTVDLELEIENNRPYPFCTFQYVSIENSSTTLPMDYIITFEIVREWCKCIKVPSGTT